MEKNLDWTSMEHDDWIYHSFSLYACRFTSKENTMDFFIGRWYACSISKAWNSDPVEGRIDHMRFPLGFSVMINSSPHLPLSWPVFISPSVSLSKPYVRLNKDIVKKYVNPLCENYTRFCHVHTLSHCKTSLCNEGHWVYCETADGFIALRYGQGKTQEKWFLAFFVHAKKFLRKTNWCNVHFH